MRTQRVCVHAWVYLFSQFVASLPLFYFLFFCCCYPRCSSVLRILYSVFISISCCFHLFSVLTFCRLFFAIQKNATDIRRTIRRFFQYFRQNLGFECSWKGRANANNFSISIEKRIRFLRSIQSYLCLKNKKKKSEVAQSSSIAIAEVFVFNIVRGEWKCSKWKKNM